MNITWRDGITTLAAAGAVIVERAYFHDYAWPLVSSARWTVAIIAGLLAVGFMASYTFDKAKSVGWTFAASLLGVMGAVFAAFGLATGDSDYVVLMMLTTVAFWLAAMVRHLIVRKSMPVVHA